MLVTILAQRFSSNRLLNIDDQMHYERTRPKLEVIIQFDGLFNGLCATSNFKETFRNTDIPSTTGLWTVSGSFAICITKWILKALQLLRQMTLPDKCSMLKITVFQRNVLPVLGGLPFG